MHCKNILLGTEGRTNKSREHLLNLKQIVCTHKITEIQMEQIETEVAAQALNNTCYTGSTVSREKENMVFIT